MEIIFSKRNAREERLSPTNKTINAPVKFLNESEEFFSAPCFHLGVSRYIEEALGGTIIPRSQLFRIVAAPAN
jgi:hypothetical protein